MKWIWKLVTGLGLSHPLMNSYHWYLASLNIGVSFDPENNFIGHGSLISANEWIWFGKTLQESRNIEGLMYLRWMPHLTQFSCRKKPSLPSIILQKKSYHRTDSVVSSPSLLKSSQPEGNESNQHSPTRTLNNFTKPYHTRVRNNPMAPGQVTSQVTSHPKPYGATRGRGGGSRKAAPCRRW
jgi:hypothetical protein